MIICGYLGQSWCFLIAAVTLVFEKQAIHGIEITVGLHTLRPQKHKTKLELE
jgi:hypothetical protein